MEEFKKSSMEDAATSNYQQILGAMIAQILKTVKMKGWKFAQMQQIWDLTTKYVQDMEGILKPLVKKQ